MLLSASLSFLTQAILARTLSLHEYGLFSAINNFILVVTPLAGLGIGNYWLKKFGQKGWDGRLWVGPSLLILATSLPLGLIFTVLVGWHLWPDTASHALLILLCPVMLMQSCGNAARSRFQLEERYTALAIWNMVPVIVKFLIVCLTAIMVLGLFGLAACLSVSMLAISLVGLWYAYPLKSGRIQLVGHGQRPTRFDNSKLLHKGIAQKDIFKEMLPFALGSFFGLVFLQSDIFILSFLAGSEQAGLYSAAFAVMAAIYFLPGAIFSQYLLPKYHRWTERDNEKLLNVFRFGNMAMLTIGSIIMVAVFLLAPHIIPLIFGDRFQGTAEILQWLALCIPLRFISSSVGGALVTKENMKRKVFYQGVAALLNVCLNFLLIPIYQVYGAVISTVASECILLGLYLFGAQKHVFRSCVLRGWHLDWRIFRH